ncbi:MAG: hypothetical protein ACYC99_12575 [Candidatus Geothermincolia bacterium]
MAASADKDIKKKKGSRQLAIGSSVISLLGITFGGCCMVAGSLLTWRSDRVLGLYNQSGWRFSNIVSGDGKITMALGILVVVGLVVGVIFKSRLGYGVALVADLAVMAIGLYELIFLFSRQGIVSPGNGIYMVIGGSVAGGLCALGGYLMMAEAFGKAGVAGAPSAEQETA